MNTEQMNRVNIEDLDKLKSEYDLMCVYAYGHVYNDFEQHYDRDVLNKCIWFKPLYWSVIMPVWQKLRGEILEPKDTVSSLRQFELMKGIRTAILNSDITTAHQLIYKAIEQL